MLAAGPAEVENPVDYAGISMFDNPSVGSTRNCLGDIYRNYALGFEPIGRCNANGNWVPDTVNDIFD